MHCCCSFLIRGWIAAETQHLRRAFLNNTRPLCVLDQYLPQRQRLKLLSLGKCLPLDLLLVFCYSYAGDVEINVEIKKYFCKAGVKGVQVW